MGVDNRLVKLSIYKFHCQYHHKGMYPVLPTCIMCEKNLSSEVRCNCYIKDRLKLGAVIDLRNAQ